MEILPALAKPSGEVNDPLDIALDRAGFVILGKTIYFNSIYPDWVLKTADAKERFENANLIQDIIKTNGLKTPFVPEKILVWARNFGLPLLLVERIWMQECDQEIRTFYQQLTIDEQAEVAFVLLKSGIADTNATENLPQATRKRVAFIDTAHRHEMFRMRLESYNSFINKLADTSKEQFYVFNDTGAEDEEIAKAIDDLKGPKDLLGPWGNERTVPFNVARETFLKGANL